MEKVFIKQRQLQDVLDMTLLKEILKQEIGLRIRLIPNMALSHGVKIRGATLMAHGFSQ